MAVLGRQSSKLVLFLLILIMMGGCSANISGTTFLDKNGNNRRDAEDPAIANLTYQITLDDEPLTTAKTIGDGSYMMSLSKMGTYCVIVPDDSLTTTGGSGAPKTLTMTTEEGADSGDADDEARMKRMTATRGETTGDTSTGGSDTTGGTTAGGTGSGATGGSTTDGGTGGSTGGTEPSTTSGGSGTSGTSGAETQATVESGKACQKSQGIGLDLDVPIAVDYASAITAIEAPAKQTKSRGDTLEFDVKFPVHCTFKTLFLSPSLIPIADPANPGVTTAGYYDPATGQFDFNAAIQASMTIAGAVSASTPMTLNADPLATFKWNLLVKQDGGLDKKTVTISPVMTCPDHSSIALKTMTVDIDNSKDFTVTQNRTSADEQVIPGGTMTVVTSVVNNSPTAYPKDQMSLTITVSGASTATYISNAAEGSCDNHGGSGICTFPIAASSAATPATFTTSVILPGNKDDTTISVSAKLTVTSESGATATYGDDTSKVSVTVKGTESST